MVGTLRKRKASHLSKKAKKRKVSKKGDFKFILSDTAHLINKAKKPTTCPPKDSLNITSNTKVEDKTTEKSKPKAALIENMKEKAKEFLEAVDESKELMKIPLFEWMGEEEGSRKTKFTFGGTEIWLGNKLPESWIKFKEVHLKEAGTVKLLKFDDKEKDDKLVHAENGPVKLLKFDEEKKDDIQVPDQAENEKKKDDIPVPKTVFGFQLMFKETNTSSRSARGGRNNHSSLRILDPETYLALSGNVNESPYWIVLKSTLKKNKHTKKHFVGYHRKVKKTAPLFTVEFLKLKETTECQVIDLTIALNNTYLKTYNFHIYINMDHHQYKGLDLLDGQLAISDWLELWRGSKEVVFDNPMNSIAMAAIKRKPRIFKRMLQRGTRVEKNETKEGSCKENVYLSDGPTLCHVIANIPVESPEEMKKILRDFRLARAWGYNDHVNCQDTRGIRHTMAHHAAYRRNHILLKEILSMKADVTIPTRTENIKTDKFCIQGNTPLHTALFRKNKNLECVELILNHAIKSEQEEDDCKLREDHENLRKRNPDLQSVLDIALENEVDTIDDLLKFLWKTEVGKQIIREKQESLRKKIVDEKLSSKSGSLEFCQFLKFPKRKKKDDMLPKPERHIKKCKAKDLCSKVLKYMDAR